MNESILHKGESNMQAVASKYLSFTLAEEEYGIEILKVNEIIGLIDITSVPQTPEFVKGIINLRGKVIPVIDMRIKFGMPEIEYSKDTCIIIVDLGNKQMGIVIDAVREVLDISTSDIERTPSFGVAVDTDFIQGIGKIEDRVIILLDIDHVLTSEELVAISSM